MMVFPLNATTPVSFFHDDECLYLIFHHLPQNRVGQPFPSADGNALYHTFPTISFE